MERITETVHDIKAVNPQISKPLSRVYKFLYIASIATFMSALVYGSYKGVYTITNISSYKSDIKDASIYREAIDQIDAKIAETGKLYTFFEDQQKWLLGVHSSAKLWSEIFQSMPIFISIDAAKLNFSENSATIYITYIKHRRSSPNPIAEFSKGIEQLGYRFVLKREGCVKKGEYFFEGQLETRTDNRKALNESA